MIAPVVLALVLVSGPRVEGFLGASLSAPSRLSLVFDDGSRVEQDASWDTESLRPPIYWLVRAGWDFGRWELAVELVHQKLVLKNPQPPIEQFQISHGFNLVVASAALELGAEVLVRAGAGVVVAHSEGVIGGVLFGRTGPFDGYVVGGPVGALALERRIRVWKWVSLVVGVAGTAAWVDVPIAGGRARTTDFALHAQVGASAGPR